jgi:immune inhibitor A
VTPRTIVALTGAAAVACTLAISAPASAQPADDAPSSAGTTHRSDNRPGPKSAEQAEKRAKALALLDNGKATLKQRAGGGATVSLSSKPGDVVEFPVNRTDKIFTVLAEFGTEGAGRYGLEPGPLHNEIPKPDRSVDNSTYWESDFNRAHYDTLFNGSGESFKDYYSKLSSGKYQVDTTVTDWVKVPGNASSYGDNAVEDAGGAWDFVGDSVDAWYASQTADKTDDEINAYLAQFDVWDRYDFNENGNFNEPDGYLDHFQAVHAGEGEEAGGGGDAIWSHRWYVNSTDYGTTGPVVGGVQNLYGGTRIGNSNYYVGDYTVEPENGGLGVFAHEYGHDLGLPDYYDTAGGENGSAFWTLMSSGSWLGHGAAASDGIGTTPGLMGPEEKRFLGWLDYSQVNAGQSGTFLLGPSQNTYKNADQAVKVNLPDSEREENYVDLAGGHAWWSGRGDELNNTLEHSVTVPSGASVTLAADLWYDIETNYDYLYAEYSVNGGDKWVQIGQPITGEGTRWAGKRWSLRGVEGDVLLRFRYATDGGVNEIGAFLDNIVVTVGRDTALSDDVESGNQGWTADGWKISTGTETTGGDRYYLLENRQYVGYDATLEVGPYQFSEAITRPNWVEFFSFNPGMLVWFVDQGMADNNVSQHLGEGNALPVDARPNSLTYPDGSSPTNRREPFDATFGLSPVERTCLHKQVAGNQPGTYTTLEACNSDADRVAKPTFDDTLVDQYYSTAAPQNSVKVANEGVKATVVSEDAGFLTVDVSYLGK